MNHKIIVGQIDNKNTDTMDIIYSTKSQSTTQDNKISTLFSWKTTYNSLIQLN